VLDNFLQLPGYKNIPSVCELPIDKLETANSHIWGPRWTLGTQNTEVAQMHAEGRKAYVWTLDVPGNIQTFLKEGNFDGILTNYPSAVAFYYYAKQ
jgi:glycerophosphoryl diester phosphodiesterase